MGERDPSRRSGEHRSEDSTQNPTMTNDEAMAIARAGLDLKQVIRDVRDVKDSIADLQGMISNQREEAIRRDGDIKATLAVGATKHQEFEKRITVIEERFEAKASSWAGIIPTIVATVISGLLSSALVASIMFATVRDSNNQVAHGNGAGNAGSGGASTKTGP